VNCYILTGGRSTRMGTSKAALFLDRVAAAASSVFDATYAVQRHGQAALRIPTIFEASHEHEAPLFGVIASLEHARERCFILATDYPFITPDALSDLRRRFEAASSFLVVPVFREIPQVLCAGYAFELLPLLRKRAGEGKLDLQSLITEVDTVLVPVAGDAWLNINTLSDLKEAERLR
jgi:molybdopterin-guanine dinucleotide biosynthesis protein A